MLLEIRRTLRRLSGPLTIVVWQVAPVSTVQDESGRTRLTLGWGHASYLERMYSYAGCYGEERTLQDEYPVDQNVAGAQLEHWTSPTRRVTVWATDVTGDRTGLAGGFAYGWEKRSIGFGLGLALSPFEIEMGEGETLPTVTPSLSLRVGGLDGVHGLIDVMPPSPVSFLTGYSRIGLGLNRGRKSGFSALAGVAACVFCDAADEDGTATFAELGVPLGHRFDLLAYGLTGPDEVRVFGIGLRTRF